MDILGFHTSNCKIVVFRWCHDLRDNFGLRVSVKEEEARWFSRELMLGSETVSRGRREEYD